MTVNQNATNKINECKGTIAKKDGVNDGIVVTSDMGLVISSKLDSVSSPIIPFYNNREKKDIKNIRF